MMKTKFSIERALADGLTLSFKKPLTVFLWGLMTLAPSALALGGLAAMMGPEGLSGNPEAMFGPQAIGANLAINGANGIQLLLSVFVAAAVIRATAVAHKRRKARAPFLGFGMEELLTAASMLALGIGICAVIFPLVLVGAGLGFGFYSLGGVWVWLPVTLYGLAVIVGVIYLALRLSLLVPASALTGTVALPAAWRATRGQAGSLLGLAIVVWIIQVLIAVAAVVVIMLLVVGAGAAVGWRWEPLEDMETLADLVLPWPMMVAGGLALLVFTWLQGVAQAMALASFTSVWLQLNPPKFPEAADAAAPDALASPEL